MTRDELVAYCLAKPGAWEDEPWESDIVAKVHDKIFAFFGADDSDTTSVGLKLGGNREEADEWLLRYPDDAFKMAYIGRSGWNTLDVGASIPDEEIIEAVDTSYDTVVSKLSRTHRPEGKAQP